jgi:hypothetical protein
VEELLAARPQGLFRALGQLEAMHRKRWGEALPAGWLDTMEAASGLAVERTRGADNPVCSLKYKEVAKSTVVQGLVAQTAVEVKAVEQSVKDLYRGLGLAVDPVCSPSGTYFRGWNIRLLEYQLCYSCSVLLRSVKFTGIRELVPCPTSGSCRALGRSNHAVRCRGPEGPVHLVPIYMASKEF